MNRGLAAALCASVSMFVAPVAVRAQQTTTPPTPAPAEAAATGIQDIVVTANRVESKAQKTAIALTVYSADALASKGITNVQTLGTIDPSISVVSGTGAAYVAVRGIASTDVTEIGDPAVPIARDGFYTNRSYSIGASMYDIARVEVLKGPQGTLNGRNSTGGLINVLTQRPEFRDGGYVDMGVGNYGAYHSEAAVNIGLTDTLAIRASGVFDYHNGYRYVNVQSSGRTERGDDNNVASGRLQMAWNPLPDLHLWASYQHDSVIGTGDLAEDTPLGVYTPVTNSKNFVNGAPTSVNLTGDRVRWEIREDALPLGLKFIYAGGYDVEDWKHSLDDGPVGANGGDGTGYPAYEQYVQHEHPKTWNHEIRISNDSQSRLFVQAGWFHFLETNNVTSGLLVAQMTGPFAKGGALAQYSQAGNYGILFQYPYVGDRSDAAFGYLTYRITDQLKFSAGARETWDRKIRTGQATLLLPALVYPLCGVGFPATAGSCPPFPLVTPGAGNVSEKQPTFHVGLDWTPTNQTLVYAKFDTGYKAGGFNSNGSAPPVPYGDEKVSTGEIGTKNHFLDNRLQLNLDGFYTRYTGYQASAPLSALNGGSGVFNAGDADIYGAEAQVVALFGQGGQIDFNSTVLHAKFTGDPQIANAAGTAVVGIGGNHLPNAPSLAFNAGLQQTVPVFGGTVMGRVEGKYSSSFYYSVFNTKDAESFRFMTGNVELTYRPNRGRWEIEGYVRNFTNKLVFANAVENYTAGYNTYEFQPPRTFGVRGSVKF